MKKINKKIYANLLEDQKRNSIKPRILVICAISLLLLIEFTPVLSVAWLITSTFYLSYISSYKDIYKIWGFTIGMWYLIFSTSLSEITILIGYGNTEIILDYLMDNSFLFENLCFQTLYILDILSSKFGFSIYIPALINIFSVFSKDVKR